MEHNENPHSQPGVMSPENGTYKEPGAAPQSFNDVLDSYNEVSANHNGQSYSHESAAHSGVGSPPPAEYHDRPVQSEDRPDYANTGTTLYVSKLSYKTSEETLYQEFSKFGKLQKCNLVVDPHTKDSRGFAFITYENVDDASLALTETNSLRIDGALVLVERSRRSRPRSPTPGRYSGAKPLPDNRMRHGDRRDFRQPRDHYERSMGRGPYERYPPREMGYGHPRDRGFEYPSRYGLREPFPERMRDREYDRSFRGREYVRERIPYPPRDPREMHGFPRDSRIPRDFRPREPRERYPDFPRGRDPREADLLPYDRERVSMRHREEPIGERIRDDRPAQYPPVREDREFRPRYE